VQDADSLTAAQLVSDSDNGLFENVLKNKNHFLYKLLLERSTYYYYLRAKSHGRSMSVWEGSSVRGPLFTIVGSVGPQVRPWNKTIKFYPTPRHWFNVNFDLIAVFRIVAHWCCMQIYSS